MLFRSFTMLGLGNELGGDVDLMRNWLDGFRKHDNRHLYSFGSNNFLGWGVGASALLRRNLLIYGIGGVIAPFSPSNVVSRPSRTLKFALFLSRRGIG